MWHCRRSAGGAATTLDNMTYRALAEDVEAVYSYIQRTEHHLALVEQLLRNTSESYKADFG